MIYPVRNFKTEWNLTAGNEFGQAVSYGFHEGNDLNMNGGGDIELGKDILAIAKGDLVYYHTAKHPTTGFGYHNVYRIQGAWGMRWVHQAHNLPDLLTTVGTLNEGDVIAHAGKSGTTYAHVHFSIFKVDPASLPFGIDTIAKNQTDLNNWWEDPIKFIEKYMTPVVPPIDYKVKYEAEQVKNKTLQEKLDKIKVIAS